MKLMISSLIAAMLVAAPAWADGARRHGPNHHHGHHAYHGDHFHPRGAAWGHYKRSHVYRHYYRYRESYAYAPPPPGVHIVLPGIHIPFYR